LTAVSAPIVREAVSADGLPIRYEVAGDGEPALVFVHGWSCDRRYWGGQVGAFADRYRVVAIDLAGHGESGIGRSSWTMAAFGEDVVVVVDRLGLRRVVLVGHSMGGDVIVEAALRLGDRVAGLVWADTYTTLDDPPTAKELEAFEAPVRADFVAGTGALVREMCIPSTDPALVDWIAADMASAPPEIALEALHNAVSNQGPVDAALPKLRAPVVAINPDSRPTDVASLERHGIRTVLMPGVGHFLMQEDPEGFNRLLQEAIETFEAA
jgi:pimeloyl-ACP methyl ester carboxylesterase